MPGPLTTPVSNTQFQGWASFFGGNVQAPQAPPPSVWGAGNLGQPPTNGQYTGGWAYPDAWANFYEGKQGFTAPQNQNSPAGALAASQYGNNVNNPNDPNLLGWEQAYGNPNTILKQDQNWAKSLGSAPISTPSNQLTGGWQNPEAWAAFYGGTNGFTAPKNAGSPASALEAAHQIAQTSNPETNPALVGWVSDFGQPGSVLANTPNWAASLGNPAVDSQGTDIGQTNTGGWVSPLAWAAYYGGFQGFDGAKDNTLQAAQNWAGVTNKMDPSLLGWELDYGNPQSVISIIQASPAYQQFQTSQQAAVDAANAQQAANIAAYNAAQQAFQQKQASLSGLQSQAQSLQDQINKLNAVNNQTAARALQQQLNGINQQISTITGTPAPTPPVGPATFDPTSSNPYVGAFSNLAPPPSILNLTYGPSAASEFTAAPTTITGSGSAQTSGGFQINASTPPEVLAMGVGRPTVGFQQSLLNTQAQQLAIQQAASRNPKSGGSLSGGPASVGGTQTNPYFGAGQYNLAYDYPLLAKQYAETFNNPALGNSYAQYALGIDGAQQAADLHQDIVQDQQDNEFANAIPFWQFGANSMGDLAKALVEMSQQGLVPDLSAPGGGTFAPIDLPPEYNTNVDDYGRPIPDVGPPQPFNMPDFGNFVTQDLPPLELPPTWTNPIAPQPEVNLSGVNPNVTFDQVARTEGVTPGQTPEQVQAAQPTATTWPVASIPTPQFPIQAANPIDYSGAPYADFGQTAPIDSGGVPSTPADVFGFGADTLYQGGYGQPVQDQLPPPQPFSSAEQFVQKYGTTTTLRQILNDVPPEMLKGYPLKTVLYALGTGVDVPIDLTQPGFMNQLKAALDAGGAWGGDQVISGLTAAMKGGPQAIADAAQDSQQDREEGPGAYGQLGYNTVPIYGSQGANAVPAETHPVPPADIPYNNATAARPASYDLGARFAALPAPSFSYSNLPYSFYTEPPPEGTLGYGNYDVNPAYGPYGTAVPPVPPQTWSDTQEAGQQITDRTLINTILSRGLNWSYPQLVQMGADFLRPYLASGSPEFGGPPVEYNVGQGFGGGSPDELSQGSIVSPPEFSLPGPYEVPGVEPTGFGYPGFHQPVEGPGGAAESAAANTQPPLSTAPGSFSEAPYQQAGSQFDRLLSQPYDVGTGFGGGFQEAPPPPPEMQAGYAYPSGSLGGTESPIDWTNLSNLNFLQEDVPAAASVPADVTTAWPGSGYPEGPDITGPEVASRAYTPGQKSALVTDFGYTGPTGAYGLASENPLQDGMVYTTPVSTFGGNADPNMGAVSGHKVNDTEYSVALPVTEEVAREINANGGLAIIGPNGTATNVYVSDIGPNQATEGRGEKQLSSINRGMDLSPALYRALGAGTDQTVQILYNSGGDEVTYSSSPSANQFISNGAQADHPVPPADIPNVGGMQDPFSNYATATGGPVENAANAYLYTPQTIGETGVTGSHLSGTVGLGNDENGVPFFGGGGRGGSAYAIPFGTYYLNFGLTSQGGGVGPQGASGWGGRGPAAIAGISTNPTGNTVTGPYQYGDRAGPTMWTNDGIELHSLFSQNGTVTLGCIGIQHDSWPQFSQQLQNFANQMGGKLTITVSPGTNGAQNAVATIQPYQYPQDQPLPYPYYTIPGR